MAAPGDGAARLPLPAAAPGRRDAAETPQVSRGRGATLRSQTLLRLAGLGQRGDWSHDGRRGSRLLFLGGRGLLSTQGSLSRTERSLLPSSRAAPRCRFPPENGRDRGAGGSTRTSEFKRTLKLQGLPHSFLKQGGGTGFIASRPPSTPVAGAMTCRRRGWGRISYRDADDGQILRQREQ